MCIAMIKRKCL